MPWSDPKTNAPSHRGPTGCARRKISKTRPSRPWQINRRSIRLCSGTGRPPSAWWNRQGGLFYRERGESDNFCLSPNNSVRPVPISQSNVFLTLSTLLESRRYLKCIKTGASPSTISSRLTLINKLFIINL